jgi:hypothetical protein
LPYVAADVHGALEAMRDGASAGFQRYRPLWHVENLSEVIAALRSIRRNGPGRLRASALDALVYLAGPAALDPMDTAVIERHIRIRQRRDPLQAVMSCWTYWWCIRSDDQSAVITSLGLTDLRPVTYTLASSIIDILEHDDRESGIVYAGPAINGWTPIVGPRCDAFGEHRLEVQAVLERLSTEYGEAHAFYFGAQADGSAWLVARNGETIRRYSSIDPGQCVGEPLPIERIWLDANGVPGRPEEHLMADDQFREALWDFPEANEIAAAISLDVGWHRPTDAEPHGTPVMAVLPGSTGAALPPGAYEI